MKFYDRANEMQILQENEAQAERSAVFTVLMGRRRVGKTSLILHALEGRDYAYLFISKDSEAVLCRKLQASLEEQLGIHVYGTLTHFRDLFEVIMRESINRHFTVVFDEFQTLHKINPAIFSEIQDIWDRYHTESRLNLIASGSIQSLMKRIFEDENEKMNLGLDAVKGEVLVVSQFTLYGNCRKGRRPSFTDAAGPELGERLYEKFLSICEELGYPPQHGQFGADMQVESINDGPVTLILDTDQLMNEPRNK